MECTPVKKEGIADLAKASRLDLSKERAELLVEIVNEVFQMVDSLDGVEPGSPDAAPG